MGEQNLIQINVHIRICTAWRVLARSEGKISYPSRTSRVGSMIRRWWSISWRKFGACWMEPGAFPASSTVSASRWATSWAWFRTFHRSPGTWVSSAPLDSLSSNSNLRKKEISTFSRYSRSYIPACRNSSSLSFSRLFIELAKLDGSISKSFRGWIMQRSSPDSRSLCRVLFRYSTKLACQPSHARCILRCCSLYLIITNCWLIVADQASRRNLDFHAFS